jgi:hypothetical protein
VHPLASVDPEHRRICHARRTAIGRNSIESAGSGLSETDQTMRDLPCSSGTVGAASDSGLKSPRAVLSRSTW